MKVLVDMNLSPEWVRFFAAQAIEALHWSDVGDPRAADVVVMSWARDHGFIVFTHDLDFGTLLATAGVAGPSVIQVRAQAILPDDLGSRIVDVLRSCADELSRGALVSVDDANARVRILPIRSRIT